VEVRRQSSVFRQPIANRPASQPGQPIGRWLRTWPLQALAGGRPIHPISHSNALSSRHLHAISGTCPSRHVDCSRWGGESSAERSQPVASCIPHVVGAAGWGELQIFDRRAVGRQQVARSDVGHLRAAPSLTPTRARGVLRAAPRKPAVFRPLVVCTLTCDGPSRCQSSAADRAG
jgi:hypothetical protein